MTNFLDDVPMRTIDDIANEDTIEMVLSASAMQALSGAAALEEPAHSSVERALAPAATSAPVPAAVPVVVGAPSPALAPIAVPVLGAASSPAPVSSPPALAPGAMSGPVRASAPAPAESDAPRESPPERRPPMSTLRFAVILASVAVASALVTAGTYFATATPIQPSGPIATTLVFSPPAPIVVAPPALPPVAAPSPAPPDSAPVRFANPFDRKEVFEFPAGTSQSEARDAVAELLYERAQERQPPGPGMVSGTSVKPATSATAAATPVVKKAGQ